MTRRVEKGIMLPHDQWCVEPPGSDTGVLEISEEYQKQILPAQDLW